MCWPRVVHPCTAKTQYRKLETNIPEKKLRGLSVNFQIYVSVSVEIGTETTQFSFWKNMFSYFRYYVFAVHGGTTVQEANIKSHAQA